MLKISNDSSLTLTPLDTNFAGKYISLKDEYEVCECEPTRQKLISTKGKMAIVEDDLQYSVKANRGAPILSSNGEIIGMHLSSGRDTPSKGILFGERVKQCFFAAVKATMGLKASMASITQVSTSAANGSSSPLSIRSPSVASP